MAPESLKGISYHCIRQLYSLVLIVVLIRFDAFIIGFSFLSSSGGGTIST